MTLDLDRLLLDTSVLSRWVRAQDRRAAPAERRRLRRFHEDATAYMDAAETVVLCSPVRLELLHAATNPGALRDAERLCADLVRDDTRDADFQAAIDLWHRVKGMRHPAAANRKSPKGMDSLIAAVALRTRSWLLTADKGFHVYETTFRSAGLGVIVLPVPEDA